MLDKNKLKNRRRPTMKKISIGLIALTFVLVSASSTMAATDTGTLNVSASVLGTARITSVGAMSFSNYDPTEPSAPNDATGSVSVRATKGLSYTIYIGAARTMSDGTDTLNYELYSDAPGSTVWGSTQPTGVGYTSAGNAVSTKTIYGRIPVLQDVPAGVYIGTVTVTLEF
jgi:spore coat protein U-like protein